VSDEARKHETVTRIRLETTMTEENRPKNTEHQPKARRAVRLPAPEKPAQPATSSARHSSASARASLKDRLLRAAERLVGDWAPTLRAAAFRVVLFLLVLIVIGVAFGFEFAALGAVIGFLTFLVGRAGRRG
jgi:preprotein translocase subunit SecF